MKLVFCPHCNGYGQLDRLDRSKGDCPKCKGTGRVTKAEAELYQSPVALSRQDGHQQADSTDALSDLTGEQP